MTMHKNFPAMPLAGLKIVVEHLIAGLANRSLTNFCKKKYLDDFGKSCQKIAKIVEIF
jgi:hypothetical protein